MIDIKRQCPCCGEENTVSVNENDYANYKNGFLVQTAFPYLNADEREIIMTGICKKCWNNMF